LAGRAPVNGIQVILTSGNIAASVPASITIPANSTFANFTIATSTVSNAQPSLITANYGGRNLSRTLTVLPNGVVGLLLTPNPVTGGNDVQGTVTLSCPAQSNQLIFLSTTNRDIAYPVSDNISISANNISGTFTVKTVYASKVRNAAIKADTNNIAKSVQLTVNP
jgi:trimeric autotransporter adhesin